MRSRRWAKCASICGRRCCANGQGLGENRSSRRSNPITRVCVISKPRSRFERPRASLDRAFTEAHRLPTVRVLKAGHQVALSKETEPAIERNQLTPPSADLRAAQVGSSPAGADNAPLSRWIIPMAWHRCRNVRFSRSSRYQPWRPHLSHDSENVEFPR